MDELDIKYLKIWELAKPYYEKGRIYDIPHIEWIMKEAHKIALEEKLDEDLLIPVCILHDVGYSGLGLNNPNVKSQETKKIHMQEGAKIADSILKKVSFDPKKSKKVVHLVSVHDNWVLGDDSPFKESKEMAVFNDLDFMWPFTSLKQFETTASSMGLSPKEADEFWEKDEKFARRPLCCKSTIKLFSDYKKKIKKALNERA